LLDVDSSIVENTLSIGAGLHNASQEITAVRGKLVVSFQKYKTDHLQAQMKSFPDCIIQFLFSFWR